MRIGRLGHIMGALPTTREDPAPRTSGITDYVGMWNMGGIPRRAFLTTFPLVLGGVAISCKKKPPPEEMPEPTRLQKGMYRLKRYLANQKAADVKKVDGIFVSEQVAEDVSVLRSMGVPEKYWSRIQQRARATAKEFSPTTIAIYDIDARSSAITLHAVFVMVPLRVVEVFTGPPRIRHRQMFDETLYHEVECHGREYHNLNSDHWKLAKKIYAVVKSKRMTDRLLYEPSEFMAYAQELDWLMRKRNFRRWRRTMPSSYVREFESYVVRYTMTLLQYREHKNFPDKRMHEIVKLYTAYMKNVTAGLSRETRAYLRKLLRNAGWRKTIPF